MPFYPPFTNGFRPGDVVYGLGTQRRINAVQTFRIAINDAFWKIDQYNVTQSERQKQIESGRLGPAKQQEFIDYLCGHPKYRRLIFATEGTPHQWTTDVREKCKAGIMWITQARSTVHFVLDGLDLGGVISKSAPGDVGTSPGEKYRAITGAELRWIYRNQWNANVRQHVQFWLDGKPTLPPWRWSSADSQAWATYKDI